MDQWASTELGGGLPYWQNAIRQMGSTEGLESWQGSLRTELKHCAGSFEEATGCRRVVGQGLPLPGAAATTFLSIDFDGVLHPLAAALAVEATSDSRNRLLRAGLFCHCQMLEDLLGTHQDVALLVHSSWRLTCTAERIRELLGSLGHRLRGITPKHIVAREPSILVTLRRLQIPPQRLVVLDDQPMLFRLLSLHLVTCPSQEGLAPVIDQLDAALTKAAAWKP